MSVRGSAGQRAASQSQMRDVDVCERGHARPRLRQVETGRTAAAALNNRLHNPSVLTEQPLNTNQDHLSPTDSASALSLLALRNIIGSVNCINLNTKIISFHVMCKVDSLSRVTVSTRS